MTEKIDSIRSSKPIAAIHQEEVKLQQQREKTGSHAEDRVSLGGNETVGKTYGPGIKAASPYELLRNLVINTFKEQGLDLQIGTGEGEIDFNTMTQEEAQELVADDGYFGVEKTSQRIVDFAINAFGHDPAKLEQMKDAINQGFLDAQEAFGGALPEISQQTYDAIMEKLDAFAGQSEE